MENSFLKRKVLIADDHALTADTLALILNQNGCEAVAVYSGEEAVRLSAKLQPDVLISDVIMKKMNGIEAALLIGRSSPACEIILVSGEPETVALVETARREGHCIEVLPKPVHPTHLLARLHGARFTDPKPN
jgi:CheY-like chemotaxis protein